MLSLQSCAFLRRPLAVGWPTGRMAAHLLEIHRGAFLLRSNGFLMIVSLRELQWGVRLMHFALFCLCFLIFEKKQLRSIWSSRQGVDLVQIAEFKKAYKTCAKLNILMFWMSSKLQNAQFHTGFIVFVGPRDFAQIDTLPTVRNRSHHRKITICKNARKVKQT